MVNIKELNKAIKVIENYCKDLENEQQFVIKPNKDIDIELCSIISVISKLSTERNMCIGKYLFLLNKKYEKLNKITNCITHDYLINLPSRY